MWPPVLPPPLLRWTVREATAAQPPQLQTSKQQGKKRKQANNNQKPDLTYNVDHALCFIPID
jgi:hypothetical protein